jgi:hypothetical protein
MIQASTPNTKEGENIKGTNHKQKRRQMRKKQQKIADKKG